MWQDSIQVGLKQKISDNMDWIDLAHVEILWSVLVKLVMKFVFHKISESF